MKSNPNDVRQIHITVALTCFRLSSESTRRTVDVNFSRILKPTKLIELSSDTSFRRAPFQSPTISSIYKANMVVRRQHVLAPDARLTSSSNKSVECGRRANHHLVVKGIQKNISSTLQTFCRILGNYVTFFDVPKIHIRGFCIPIFLAYSRIY